jgi:hypothetical protein
MRLPNSSQPLAEEKPTPDPDFIQPDLCSRCAAAGHAELAEAVRGGLSADGHLLADEYPPVPRASGIDRAIRSSTAAAVLAVAGIAAYVSYWHAYAVVRGQQQGTQPPGLRGAGLGGLLAGN